MDLRAPADPYGDATLRTALSDSRGAYSFDTQCECTLGLERLCTQGDLTECLRLAAKLDPASISRKRLCESKRGLRQHSIAEIALHPRGISDSHGMYVARSLHQGTVHGQVCRALNDRQAKERELRPEEVESSLIAPATSKPASAHLEIQRLIKRRRV